MAAIFEALKIQFRKADRDAAEAITDKVAEGEFAIEDAIKEVHQFSDQIANLNKSLRLKKKRLETEKAAVEESQQSAVNAAGADDAAAAERYLKEKAERQLTVDATNREIAKDEKVLGNLRAQKAQMQGEIDKAKSSVARDKATIESAKVRKGIAQASTKYGGKTTSAMAKINKLSNYAMEMEAEAEAYEDEADGNTNPDDEKYRPSAQGADVTSELDKLMKKHAPKSDA